MSLPSLPPATVLSRTLHVAALLGNPSSSKAKTVGSLNAVLARRVKDAGAALASIVLQDDQRALCAKLSALKLDASLAEIKAETVHACLLVLHMLKVALDQLAASHPAKKGEEAPLLGARDTQTVGMLLAIVARWGLAAATSDGVMPDALRDDLLGSGKPPSKVTELPDQSYLDLSRLVKSVMLLLKRQEGPSTSTAMRNPLIDIVSTRLSLCLVAALLELRHEGKKDSIWAGQQLDQLLATLHPAASMAALFHLLSGSRKQTTGSIPRWLSTSISNALSSQLMRPEGVVGLLQLTVGESDAEPTAAQLEQVSRVLLTLPAKVAAADYFPIVLPRMLRFVRAAAQHGVWPSIGVAPLKDSLMKAATFALSQLLERRPKDAETYLQPLLHRCFKATPSPADPLVSGIELLADVRALQLFALNSPPSPRLLPFLLQPILPQLFSLHVHLAEDATADPVLKGDVLGLLVLYLKTLAVDTATVSLSEALSAHEARSWPLAFSRDADGRTCIRHRSPHGDEDMPIVSPQILLELLGAVDKPELSGAVFLRWLDELEQLKQGSDSVSVAKAVARLQLVTSALDTLGTSIISRTRHTLEFVRHILVQSSSSQASEDQPAPANPGLLSGGSSSQMSGLRIIDDDQTEEAGDLGLGLASEEMQMTALSLLMALLADNTTFGSEEAGILALIGSSVTQLASAATNSSLREIAKETQQALRAHAGVPITNAAPVDPLARSRRIYQESLSLLQDAILPVRAQGLGQLRDLVSPAEHKNTDTALRPAILDIFVRALDDEDSYLYLNAIGGLADMADTGDERAVVGRLMELLTARDKASLDTKLRAGEALSQIIERKSEAVSAIVDRIVPGLLFNLRTADLPVPLRSSALTLLAKLIDASQAALNAYIAELADAALTLLSIESRPYRQGVTVEPVAAEPTPRRPNAPKYEETPDPETRDAKAQPSLRRSACLFLARLFRTGSIDARLRERAEAVLGYVGDTDQDGLVRFNAREALAELV